MPTLPAFRHVTPRRPALAHSTVRPRQRFSPVSRCAVGAVRILRLGPGHNVAIYHRNADDQNVEFYIELDQLKDEELGYFDPRPWHHDTPQRPKTWDPKIAPNLWGPLPMPDFRRDHD